MFNDILPFAFEWPLAFLLLPLPWLFKPVNGSARQNLIAPKLPIFSIYREIGLRTHEVQQQRPQWLIVLSIAAWCLLVTALAKPTLYGAPVNIDLQGRDLMMAIDISPSMKEQDLTLNNQSVTRLDVVKNVVSDFIQQRKGDRVGLILFGSEPYIQAPLTFDTQTVDTLLNEAYLGMAGQATAIGDAIALGVKRLRNRPESSRVLILLSDGANTAGEIPPEKAAQLASQEKIKIYTIGIGADEMIKRTLFMTQRVNPSADLDEKMLTTIAHTTGGEYFRARDTASLQGIYQQINKLEPVVQSDKTFRPTKSIFHWFLALALVSFCITLLAEKIKHLMQAVKGGDKNA